MENQTKTFNYEHASNKVGKLSRLDRMIRDCDMLIARYMSYEDDTTWNEPITVETNKKEIYLSEFKKTIEQL
jgi:hypothetical protein